jgi:Flp pilus assembly protein TadG
MVEGAPTPVAGNKPGRASEPPRPSSFMKRLRDQRGTAVVEFGLVVTPLLLIVFGVIDFGRALNYYNDVTQLAGQGARAAAVNTDVDGAAGDQFFQSKLAAKVDSPELLGKVGVCITQMPTNVGDPVSVKVVYNFNFLSFLGVRAGLTTATLSSTQTERAEATPTYSAGNNINPAGGTC